jgi:hypothetical protein
MSQYTKFWQDILTNVGTLMNVDTLHINECWQRLQCYCWHISKTIDTPQANVDMPLINVDKLFNEPWHADKCLHTANECSEATNECWNASYEFWHAFDKWQHAPDECWHTTGQMSNMLLNNCWHPTDSCWHSNGQMSNMPLNECWHAADECWLTPYWRRLTCY